MNRGDLPTFAPAEVRLTESYEGIDPLDVRYADAEILRYLSEEARVGFQAHIEAALAHTLADFGFCSRAVADEITLATTRVTAKEVNDREFGKSGYTATRHDVKALIESISARVSDEAKPWVHALTTSYDVVGTANVLQHREAMCHVVLPRLVGLERVLVDLTERYAAVPQIGRTHGQHAVPITFGFALSRWVGRIGESIEHLQQFNSELKGKFSGAVGAYNASSLVLDNPQAFERHILEYLDLGVVEHSTQIVPPEPLTRLLLELMITGGAMMQVAEDMRNLQRSEIAEVGEHFEKTQTGSSAMPQKRNPISFENVASLNRVLTSQAQLVLLNLISEHQRDLRDSASSRFYPLIPALVAIMAKRLTKAMAQIEVDEAAMLRNLKLSKGLIGAEPLQNALRDAGHTDAQNKVRDLTLLATNQGITLMEAITYDDEILRYWADIPETTKQAIRRPESDYLGQAEAEALKQVRIWRQRLNLK